MKKPTKIEWYKKDTGEKLTFIATKSVKKPTRISFYDRKGNDVPSNWVTKEKPNKKASKTVRVKDYWWGRFITRGPMEGELIDVFWVKDDRQPPGKFEEDRKIRITYSLPKPR